MSGGGLLDRSTRHARDASEAPTPPLRPFAMPDGMTVRYFQPDQRIADYITGYHVYAFYDDDAQAKIDWFLPGTANVRVTLGAKGPVSVRIGRRNFPDTPAVALYGPTSCALRATTHGGTMIGFGISALGWSRLFAGSASVVRNQIVALGNFWGQQVADELLDVLVNSDGAAGVKAALDAFLLDRLGAPCPDEHLLRQLMVLVVDDETIDLGTAAATIGIAPHRLRRLAARHFGFPPKSLLIRARFLRTFLELRAQPEDHAPIARRYFDQSHFLRDANMILGMTPRRFMALQTPFLDASLRWRAEVLGAATQALHAVPATPAST